MPILRERTDLDKKWTWYLFLLANVCILIGCAATWLMIVRNGANLRLLWMPTVICDLIAVALACVFMWLEAKEIVPKSAHYQKKWMWWYLAALIVFAVVIIFVIIYFVLAIQQPLENEPKFLEQLRGSKQWVLIVYFVITGVLTLVSIGIQRYARFRIDLDIYRRKHGADVKAKEQSKELAKEQKQRSKDQATSGLLDEMDKK